MSSEHGARIEHLEALIFSLETPVDVGKCHNKDVHDEFTTREYPAYVLCRFRSYNEPWFDLPPDDFQSSEQ